MLQARIVSPRGSLYFAAEATPYDLETLRSYVHDMRKPGAADVELELCVPGSTDEALRVHIDALTARLTREGVRVSRHAEQDFAA